MRFFISCSHKQGDITRKLIQEFRERGHEVIPMHLRHVLGNDVFDTKKLLSYTGGFDYVLLLLSNDYLQDEWLKQELNIFKSYEANQTDGDIILPLIIDGCRVPDFLKSNTRFVYEKESVNLLVNKIVDFTKQKKRAFVIMRLGDDSLDLMYRDGIAKALSETGHVALRSDDYKNSDKISPRILRDIKKSDVIIADLTGERPNCYYEVGYAHALGKKVLLTVKQGTKLHFDLQDHNFIFWSTPSDLKGKLIEALNFIQ